MYSLACTVVELGRLQQLLAFFHIHNISYGILGSILVPTVASASKPSLHTNTFENKVPHPSTAISINATHDNSIAFGYYGTDLRLPAFYDWSPARPTTRHQPSRYSEKRRIVRRGQVVVSIACKASRYRRRESSDTVPKSVTLSTPEYLTVLGSATADLTVPPFAKISLKYYRSTLWLYQ